MITESHELIEAYFTNDERTIIEAIWIDPETKELASEVIEAKDGDAAWEYLLTQITIDDLHESTFRHIRVEKELFENTVMKIAKEQGMVYDIDSVNTEMYKIIARSLFAPFDPEEDKEKLFMFKLQLFEMDIIKSAKNRSLKAKLRKAKTLLETTKIAIELVESTSGTTKTEETSSPLDVD